MAVEPLFRADAYLRSCEAQVLRIEPEGILLDRTVFYPLGGGQAGDAGELVLADGSCIPIVDTRKARHADATPDDALHLPAPGSAWQDRLRPGDRVTARIDWERRHCHMRLHTATHLLCAIVRQPVDGCSVTAGYARLDFAMTEALEREAVQRGLDALVAAAHPVTAEWIADEVLLARPELVRSMSVSPPLGFGRVRLLRIGDEVDLQACGGTHVANTREVGALRVARIEKKSARTRRVVLEFA